MKKIRKEFQKIDQNIRGWSIKKSIFWLNIAAKIVYKTTMESTTHEAVCRLSEVFNVLLMWSSVVFCKL